MKKQIFAFALAALGIGVLAGCPVYSDDSGYRRVCNESGCFSCSSDSYSSDCDSYSCDTSSDCPNGYSCSNYTCTAGGSGTGTGTGTGLATCSAPGDCPSGETCGSSNECYAGTDCASVGCPNPYVCELVSGSPICVGGDSDAGPIITVGGGDDGGTGTTGDATVGTGTDGSTTDGATTTTPPECSADTDCSAKGATYKCLDGTCVAPVDQCTDGTQCQSGESCVAGACTPACSSTVACPTGFACDTTKGVCTNNPTPCGTAADASTCATGTTCVDQHCVAPCTTAADGAASCPFGDVCVAGGCIPDQKASFVCQADGPGNGCANGSTCLHHNCYIGCDVDAATSCRTADQFNVCKAVTTASGTYDVCGSSSNLGSDCDPTTGKACTVAGQVCVDGYCK